jgi:hypothetical protein
VVHPFVLSVLPGTDFRASSKAINLRYHDRPPYYVIDTPDFSKDLLGAALIECEDVLDMEMDYIPPPSLVESGVARHTHPMDVPYVSKWIINPGHERVVQDIFQQVTIKATDPFTFWFKGSLFRPAKRIMAWLAHEFSLMNPHGVIRMVFEFTEPPPLSFLEEILFQCSNPNLFLNRSYEPLHGENAIVALDFTVIVPDLGDAAFRKAFIYEYITIANIVWDCMNPLQQGFSLEQAPVLISGSHKHLARHKDRLFEELREVYADREDEVMFRDYFMQREWDLLRSDKKLFRPIPEKILSTD